MSATTLPGPAPQPVQQGQGAQFYGSGGMGQYAPQPYQAFGGVPQVQAAMVNPADVQQYLDQYGTTLGASLSPYFQQQQQALSADEASRGIFNSSAGSYLSGNLGGQQAAAFASGMSPLVQQAMGFTQQDALANQASQNSANSQNAQQYGAVTSQNQQDYNQYLNELFGANQQYGNTMLGGYLGSYGQNGNLAGILGGGVQGSQYAYGDAYGGAMQNGAGMGTALGGALGQLFNNQGSSPYIQSGPYQGMGTHG